MPLAHYKQKEKKNILNARVKLSNFNLLANWFLGEFFKLNRLDWGLSLLVFLKTTCRPHPSPEAGSEDCWLDPVIRLSLITGPVCFVPDPVKGVFSIMITVIIVVIIVSPIRGRNVTRQSPGPGVTTEPLTMGHPSLISSSYGNKRW